MRKYASELIPVKTYKDTKRHQKLFPEARKGVFTIACSVTFKAEWMKFKKTFMLGGFCLLKGLKEGRGRGGGGWTSVNLQLKENLWQKYFFK